MEQDKKKGKGRSTLSWVVEFAGIHRIHYIASILLAFGSVICGFVPYLYLGDMVKALVEHTADEAYCMNRIGWMALFWVLHRLLHCFVEWMRRCNIDQNVGMALMPAQLLSILPFSAWFYMTGRTAGPDVLMIREQ